MMPLYKASIVGLIISFVSSSLYIPQAHGSTLLTTGADGLNLPKPGVMVHLSPEFTPALLKGIVIHPQDAFKFDFIVYKGDQEFTESQKKQEYTKLIKYFLASLAVPDEDQWVNLSPYEKDRIIKDDFGKTTMGRDLLAQDYLLKQITASLIYPQEALGRKFWDEIYSRAYKEFGTTNIPVNTFNKVWIVPDEADIYEKGKVAYLYKSHLKVMLEQDYLAMSKHANVGVAEGGASPSRAQAFASTAGETRGQDPNINALGSQIVCAIILPQLEKEVNEDKNFAPLRQVFSGMILAAWYKRALRESLLAKIYANKAKVKGVDQDPKNNEAIYQQYLKAYKKGVFNYIQEDVDKNTHETIPRKYFSGGWAAPKWDDGVLRRHSEGDISAAMAAAEDLRANGTGVDLAAVSVDPKDAAMAVKKKGGFNSPNPWGYGTPPGRVAEEWNLRSARIVINKIEENLKKNSGVEAESDMNKLEDIYRSFERQLEKTGVTPIKKLLMRGLMEKIQRLKSNKAMASSNAAMTDQEIRNLAQEFLKIYGESFDSRLHIDAIIKPEVRDAVRHFLFMENYKDEGEKLLDRIMSMLEFFKDERTHHGKITLKNNEEAHDAAMSVDGITLNFKQFAGEVKAGRVAPGTLIALNLYGGILRKVVTFDHLDNDVLPRLLITDTSAVYFARDIFSIQTLSVEKSTFIKWIDSWLSSVFGVRKDEAMISRRTFLIRTVGTIIGLVAAPQAVAQKVKTSDEVIFRDDQGSEINKKETYDYGSYKVKVVQMFGYAEYGHGYMELKVLNGGLLDPDHIKLTDVDPNHTPLVKNNNQPPSRAIFSDGTTLNLGNHTLKDDKGRRIKIKVAEIEKIIGQGGRVTYRIAFIYKNKTKYTLFLVVSLKDFDERAIYTIEESTLPGEPITSLNELNPGGIDMNAANLKMNIKRDGNGVPLPVSQQDLENIHIDGLVPVILEIRPAAVSLKSLLV